MILAVRGSELRQPIPHIDGTRLTVGVRRAHDAVKLDHRVHQVLADCGVPFRGLCPIQQAAMRIASGRGYALLVTIKGRLRVRLFIRCVFLSRCIRPVSRLIIHALDERMEQQAWEPGYRRLLIGRDLILTPSAGSEGIMTASRPRRPSPTSTMRECWSARDAGVLPRYASCWSVRRCHRLEA